MELHGFARKLEFEPVEQGIDYVILELRSTIVTIARYPFDFTLRVIYALNRNKVEIVYQVENRGSRYMPFAIGGHPGFRVPLIEGEEFTDYELEFTHACKPDRILFTPQVFVSGKEEPSDFEKKLDLRHDLFDDDAIVLKNMCREVTLRSKRSQRGVCVSYPDMPYLGFWHLDKTDAPYVCIEPWTSLPSRQDIVEDIACKSDMLQLAPGKTYENQWSITVF